MQTMTSSAVARVLGVPVPTVQAWVRRGLIRPVIPGTGTGHHGRYSIVDVLAVAMARALRARGLSLKTAGAALEILRGYSEADLLREFSAGRRYIALTEGGATDGLVSREEAMDQAPAEELLPTVVDVAALYHRVAGRMADRRELEVAGAR